ncbi:hypothetical protein [Streptomyces sp. NPDC005374]|uniref:MmyB family transcriptional regulator n=1 Tax=Streptomyces sp. NPDC005374 TaxID=3364713 RepID=UPI00369620A6
MPPELVNIGPAVSRAPSELIFGVGVFDGATTRSPALTGSKPAHKTCQHPQVGTVTLTSQSLHVEGTPGQRIGVHTAEPCSPDYDALLLLDTTAPALPGVSPTLSRRSATS